MVDPIFLAESRIANLADLDRYQNARGILQARVAIEILRERHADLLDKCWQRARRSIERTLKLAASKRGVRVAARFDIDILNAVPVEHAALPISFLAERFPRCRESVGRSIEADRASRQADRTQ